MSQGQNILQYIFDTISLYENKDINNWGIMYASEKADYVCVCVCVWYNVEISLNQTII